MEKYKPSLARLERIAQKHRHFLAYLLGIYQKHHELNDEQLALFLECSTDSLPSIALCRRPHSSFPLFRQDIERIAHEFHVNPTRLAQLVRNAEAHANLLNTEPEAAFLFAARDRELLIEESQEEKDERV